MKTTLIGLLFCLVSLCAFSQVQQGFNYQAIARDASGNPIPGQALPVRITIQSDSLGGTTFWIEEHSTVTTNSFGLFTLVLGKGVKKTGSTAATFNDIDWTVSPKYIKTEIDYSGWKTMGSSRLWSVPYAMYSAKAGFATNATTAVNATTATNAGYATTAGTATNATNATTATNAGYATTAGTATNALLADSAKALLKGSKLAVVSGNDLTTDPLFEVKRKDGQTVFAVYSEGVRIYVDDGIAKGVKGGFAIGGFGTGKAVSQPLFVVDADSIRAYIGTNAGKGVKGGFAIGGFGTAKAPGEQYLRVTRDSTRVYINDTIGKGVKGGFAIGGFGTAKGITSRYLSVNANRTNIQVTDTLKGFSITNIQGGGSSDFMRIDKINSFIGHETGPLTTPNPTGNEGKYNVFIGYQSGKKNTSGYKNVFLGYNAGMMNKTAEHNVFIGTESGICDSTNGRYNTFVGSQSGVYNTASENTFIGYSAGVLNETGQFNTFLGTNSGAFHSAGDYNTFLGWGSGNFNSGGKNVFVGASAGSSNTGTGNVYIGFNANLSGSNKLLITNSSNTPNVPLIYGEFNTKMIAINKASVTTGYTFWVEGAAGGLNTWNTVSDARLKTNINTIPDALSKVLKLRGVNFEWKDSSNIETGRRIGFIAQEVVTVLPEVVSKSDDTYLMQYGPVAAVLVEAVKEQQRIIIDQQKVINELLGKTEQLTKNYEELNLQINEMKSLVNNQNK
jgi:hypothetical protein